MREAETRKRKLFRQNWMHVVPADIVSHSMKTEIYDKLKMAYTCLKFFDQLYAVI